MEAILRHSRAGGNPAGSYNYPRSGQNRSVASLRDHFVHLDSRLRGNDGGE